MFYIGVDLGTSSMKLLLLNNEYEIFNIVTREYPLFIDEKNNSEQNPKDWFTQFVDGVKELILDIPKDEIAGISFSGQMHGLVILDENDEIIRNAILWNDQRTVNECIYLNDVIGRENLLEHTGNVALTGFTAPKILWVKNNEPELFKKINKIMLPKDYLAYMLSGVFATDYSDASGMLLLDVKNKCYSKFMIDIIGIKEENLPKLFESYDCIGNITEEIAALTGLSTLTKVIIGGGDQAVGAIGTGTVLNDELSISLGTSGVLFISQDNFRVDKKLSGLHSFCHSNGKYHLMGVTLAAAGSTKWWTEILKSGHSETQKDIKEIIDNQIYFLPYLSGERSPINNPNAKGVFFGMTMNTCAKDMTLAVLEGVAFSLKHIFNRLNEMGTNIKSGKIIGGGAKSDLWCQIIANALDIKIERINCEEGPAFGAAILATVGTGAFKDVESATFHIIKVTKTFLPEEKIVNHYNEKFKKYLDIYAGLENVF